MSTPFPTTKLHIPQLRPNLVCRPRLTKRLDRGLHMGRKLTLASAPAGFGKSTLITGWLAEIDPATAWLSLDEGDHLFGTAFHTFHQAGYARPVGILSGPSEAVVQDVQAHYLLLRLAGQEVDQPVSDSRLIRYRRELCA